MTVFILVLISAFCTAWLAPVANLHIIIIIIIIIIIRTYLLTYYLLAYLLTYFLKLSSHSVAVVLTLVNYVNF